MKFKENNPKEWVDRIEYPFRDRYVDLSAGRMHYIDEGEGDVVLFVHGTPVWSFLYRNFIKTLSKTYRTIAIDHIGFGLSEKPEFFEGKPQDHTRNLVEFIHKMDLKDITLVVHDFGGPIGLASAIKNPERFKQFVLFNTWLWETATNREARKIDRIIHSFFGKFLYLTVNISTRFLLKKAFTEDKYLPDHIHQQYLKPFPDKRARLSLYRIARSLVGSSDWYQKQWENLVVLENKRWLILWGAYDSFITSDFLEKWTHRLPHAEVKTFDCGHFVQEERSDKAISTVHGFLNRNRSGRQLKVNSKVLKQ